MPGFSPRPGALCGGLNDSIARLTRTRSLRFQVCDFRGGSGEGLLLQSRKGRPRAAGIAYNAGMAATSMRELGTAATVETRAQRLYFDDVWTWSREQAAALRRRDFGAIDWSNVIEEVEDVGNRHSDAWTSYCRNVISHLLKIHHSPRGTELNHWRKEVEDWRQEMHSKLRHHQGMKGKLGEMLAEAWEGGRKDGVKKLTEQARPESWAAEKRLLRRWQQGLPQECPYSLAEIAGYDPAVKDAEPDPDVWPPAVARVLNEALGADYPVRHRVPERGAGFSR